jgi:hypothetical protein
MNMKRKEKILKFVVEIIYLFINKYKMKRIQYKIQFSFSLDEIIIDYYNLYIISININIYIELNRIRNLIPIQFLLRKSKKERGGYLKIIIKKKSILHDSL